MYPYDLFTKLKSTQTQGLSGWIMLSVKANDPWEKKRKCTIECEWSVLMFPEQLPMSKWSADPYWSTGQLLLQNGPVNNNGQGKPPQCMPVKKKPPASVTFKSSSPYEEMCSQKLPPFSCPLWFVYWLRGIRNTLGTHSTFSRSVEA